MNIHQRNNIHKVATYQLVTRRGIIVYNDHETQRRYNNVTTYMKLLHIKLICYQFTLSNDSMKVK